MARLNVNPTRMELRRLKDRLKTAERGHKLLKDKSDEMVRRFLDLARENKRLREEVDGELSNALDSFAFAAAVCSPLDVAQAVSMPSVKAKVEVGEVNIMGVDVPELKISREGEVKLPYALTSASAELDSSVLSLTAFTDKLLHLAEVEKTCTMLANEIERTRRRVNALEYIMIPQLQETIKFILMKLEEDERSAIVRIMKVNSISKNKAEAARKEKERAVAPDKPKAVKASAANSKPSKSAKKPAEKTAKAKPKSTAKPKK